MGLFGRDKTEGEAYIDKCIDGLPDVRANDVFIGDVPVDYEIVAPVPRPCGDRVIIRPSAESDMTAGGLYKPDIAREKPTKGTVIAVGEDLEARADDGSKIGLGVMLPAKLYVGDEVLYGRYSGTEFEHEGETLLIVRYPDILAVYQVS